MSNNSPLLLIILDGWGYQQANPTNAITQAKTPVWNTLWNAHPHTLLSASGLDVGLPEGQMGNSEVGHMTMGAGRVIYQDLTLINKAIADGSFDRNEVLLNALNTAKRTNKAVHIMGLLSPGGVHSHEQQIYAMIKMASQQQVPQIYVHAFLDGRDTPPQSAAPSLAALQQLCAAQPHAAIASIMGRFYAMDRDKRTERTAAAIDLLLKGKSACVANSAIEGLQQAYARGETDEFVQPTHILPVTIQHGDVVIFMNFRSDRARQLSNVLTKAPDFLGDFVTLTEYDPNMAAHVAFPKPKITNVFGEVLQKYRLTQLRIAETEKYAHVTFFFNTGREESFDGEERILIPSPKVSTYDLAPAMSATAITEKIIVAIKNKTFDAIICNFANADMLGHTGQLAATIQAIEVLDTCLGQITAALDQFGGQALITADHGNAEIMWDEQSKQPHTAHTSNLVPLIYIGKRNLKFIADNDNKPYGLQDVAPTLLQLLNIPKPEEMTGTGLLAGLTQHD